MLTLNLYQTRIMTTVEFKERFEQPAHHALQASFSEIIFALLASLALCTAESQHQQQQYGTPDQPHATGVRHVSTASSGYDGGPKQPVHHRLALFTYLMMNPKGKSSPPPSTQPPPVKPSESEFDFNNGNPEDIQAVLEGTLAFSKVDVFNAFSDTPLLETLQAYDAVLAYDNAGWKEADILGDRLADYFDAGGKVVLAFPANAATYELGGRWVLGGYNLISPGNLIAGSDVLGTFDSSSSLLVGVTSLTADNALQSTGKVSAIDTVVARWQQSGNPLIVSGVRGPLGNKRNIVALNFFPPSNRVRSDFWEINTSGAAVMRNALLY